MRADCAADDRDHDLRRMEPFLYHLCKRENGFFILAMAEGKQLLFRFHAVFFRVVNQRFQRFFAAAHGF